MLTVEGESIVIFCFFVKVFFLSVQGFEFTGNELLIYNYFGKTTLIDVAVCGQLNENKIAVRNRRICGGCKATIIVHKVFYSFRPFN